MSLNKGNFLLLFFCIVIFFSVAIGSDNGELEGYYREVFLGEKKTINYFGPLDPRTRYSDSTGGLLLLDDLFKDQYINQEIQDEAFSLHRYWFNEVVEKSTCPDAVLSENLDYIRYLYRLVSMSYLFEGIKRSSTLAQQIGGENICSIAYNDLFADCSPSSSDMKKFKERVYGKFVNEIEKIRIQPFSKKELSNWTENFQNSTSLTSDPVLARLHDWCITNKKNCRQLNIEDIKNALGSFCTHDTYALKLLCSEKDSFYGLSGIPTATDLIKRSNAFNLINRSGMGEECLRRYGKVFQAKESAYPVLSKQYPLIYSSLLKSNSRYLQGELFLPGALKEFDMKGLSDFLIALKPPKIEPVVIKPKPRPKPKSKPKPVVLAAPAVEEKAPMPAPEVVEVLEKPKVSEFERGVQEIIEKGSSQVFLDMDIFRDDFEFTPEMIAELSGPIKKFQTRSALNDMKAYDTLGSLDAPVGLVFLKFLIDTENHQGLYNITTVIGEKFYVMNDIEKKYSPVYVHLKNDASTKNRWQLILLKK